MGTATGMTQLDRDRKCAVFQHTGWHQFFECFNDLTHGRSGRFPCHPVEYHEFPNCVGDLGDHQIGRDEAIVRSQQFFRPIRSTESTSARQSLRRRQTSFVELVVAAAPNGCSYIDIAERRRQQRPVRGLTHHCGGGNKVQHP
jgi:hypothetical protein